MKCSCARQEVKGLKHETNLFVSNVGELIIVQIADQAACEPILPGGWRVEATDKVHQRGFAGARGAHDGHVLPLADLQVHATQCVHLLGAHFVNFRKFFRLDDNAGVDQVFPVRISGLRLDRHANLPCVVQVRQLC